MRELIAITKALADENRVRVLLALQSGELCVCQIVELLELAPSTVSKHMSILKHARLVESRKVGRWVYCRAVGEDGTPEAKAMAALVLQLTVDDSQRRRDARKLKKILKIDPEELCKKQCQC